MGMAGALVKWLRGGDSCSEGCGFESQHCIMAGHFSHLFVVTIVILGSGIAQLIERFK